ncbi:MAG TPA: hypothetical protein VGP85_04495 [Pyrinomonadaceae bacterium]|jgi:hypothetical protein|nr:hypothetical protein [Pyrinomonadaceae bacterium]
MRSYFLALVRTSPGIFSFIVLSFVITTAQTSTKTSATPPPPPPDITADKRLGEQPGPLTTFEEELRAKRAIKLAEKEHEENLNRAREISQLSQDLKNCLKDRSALDREETKKIDRLEKLTKKIRGEAGGEDDDVQIAAPPADVPTVVSQIADNAEQLSKEVQKTPRQVVSAAVIDRANVLLQLVKILRGFIH